MSRDSFDAFLHFLPTKKPCHLHGGAERLAGSLIASQHSVQHVSAVGRRSLTMRKCIRPSHIPRAGWN